MSNKSINREAIKSLTNEIDKNFDTSQMKKSLEIAIKLRDKGAIDSDIFEKIQNLSKQSFSTRNEYMINLKVIEVLLESELQKKIMLTKK
ncbi:hypothetical protein [Vibrio diazotrophicus]|uniref:Uncharacterized protein n=1 Tax=Vibrio diazotrophicus TaxID=685 RepID=A0A329DWW8_VIBDI|nr:hypothetical protein [Vibrio diazotrophicus]RAS55260.1 hypothetical protein DET48_14711 [Vibrio diazotrophicus]